jgi:L-asparaginase
LIQTPPPQPSHLVAMSGRLERRANAASEAAAAQPLITAAQPSTTAAQPSTTAAQPGITVIAMGGTIDKDYPRSAGGYAFEIDEPAAGRVLSELPPNVSIEHVIVSVCRKDSTEINAADRQALCDAVAKVPPGGRVIVTHGTDTLVESAQALERSGAAHDKAVVFTGAMRPERFRQSDAAFNLGGAVAATGLIPTGTVAVCMGGAVVDSRFCRRDEQSHRFVDTRWGL